MISKAQIKLITSLHQKKYRIKTGTFLAEGPKIIADLYQAGLRLESLFSTEETTYPPELVQTISPAEIKKISALKQANTQLAVFHMPKTIALPASGLVLALDAVRDPGNLGTIIRLCDWFGIKQLVCSFDTVDVYNPKVVQATMGSIARVQVHYTDLPGFLHSWGGVVWGAHMEGKSVYAANWPKDLVLVMGNEANGLSQAVRSELDATVAIPSHQDTTGAESLNVAMATSILLSELRRPTEK